MNEISIFRAHPPTNGGVPFRSLAERNQELLEANNREVERRRAAESKIMNLQDRVAQLEAELDRCAAAGRALHAYMQGERV
jgi:hypothetical protein